MPDALVIGIDVGGTNTDAVLFGTCESRILACSKTPTVHASHRQSITRAIRGILEKSGVSPSAVTGVNIATTLVTNALLEDTGRDSVLVLVGYGGYPHITDRILSDVSPKAVICLPGGHTSYGKEKTPLDMKSLSNMDAYKDELFTVSSMYSPRNPEHEIAVRKYLEDGGYRCVTCAHELSCSTLNAAKRTVTAYLNTMVSEIFHEFIAQVERAIAEMGMGAEIMFLRSDGSSASAEWSRRYPVESIFSGPAASVMGAGVLAPGDGQRAVIDMGGTSTDIGRLVDGKPVFSAGAVVGRYKTIIPSLDARSFALGGDSAVWTDKGEIVVGSRRAVPACGGSLQYTITDAMNTLGMAHLGDTGASCAMSLKLGGQIGLSPREFALRVLQNAQNIFDNNMASFVNEAELSGVDVVFVGSPVSYYAQNSTVSQNPIVPRYFEVAGAVGAAVSASELSFNAHIVHRFSDDTFCSFMPHKTLYFSQIDAAISGTKREFGGWLEERSRAMGGEGGKVSMDIFTEYFGKGGPWIKSVRLTGTITLCK